MDFRASRLRSGEIIAAVAAAILLMDLLALDWYSTGGVDTVGVSGWQALSVLRWFIAITALSGIALGWFQATRRAPALPSSLSVITTVLGTLTSLALIVRVLISVPDLLGRTGASGGAYLGLVSALVLAAGALWSLREEDPPDPIRNEAIEVVQTARTADRT